MIEALIRLRRQVLNQRAIAIVCFLAISSATHAEEVPKKASKTSHFVEVLRTTRELPKGAQLSVVSQFLESKILLRKDVHGIALSPSVDLANHYLARTMPAGTPLVEGAVVADFPEALRKDVPPGRRLATIYGAPQHLAAAALCKPYESAQLRVFSTESQPKDQATVVSEEAKILSTSLDAAKDGIVVVALREDEHKTLNALLSAKTHHVTIECFDRNKYE